MNLYQICSMFVNKILLNFFKTLLSNFETYWNWQFCTTLRLQSTAICVILKLWLTAVCTVLKLQSTAVCTVLKLWLTAVCIILKLQLTAVCTVLKLWLTAVKEDMKPAHNLNFRNLFQSNIIVNAKINTLKFSISHFFSKASKKIYQEFLQIMSSCHNYIITIIRKYIIQNFSNLFSLTHT